MVSDLIAGSLSSGGVARINKLNRTKLQKPILDFVENVVRTREGVIERKSAFRKAIEDAEAL